MAKTVFSRAEERPTVFSYDYPRLRKINNLLSVIVVIISLYVIVTPFLPEIIFKIQPKSNSNYSYSNSIIAASNPELELPPRPTNNVLVIPSIGVNGLVYDGEDASVLEKGMWLRPQASTPDKESNTVIVAHRFLYTSGPNTFYHLDKLKQNDTVILYWNEVEYIYKVREEGTIVKPSAIEIEDPTVNPVLTLYTCTPLWTSENRLVYVADLISKEDYSNE